MTTRIDAALSGLDSWAATQGVELSTGQRSQFSAYLDALLFWNRRVDLVSQSDPQPIVTKHFIDSIAPARFCPRAGSIADLGSGAGFPGLVLAILLPQTSVAVIEAKAKRAAFLAEVTRLARIGNAVVHERRVESLAGDPAHKARYDVVVARALAPLPRYLSLARPLLRPGGSILVMRSGRAASEADSVILQGSLLVEHRYTLPDGSARVVLCLRCDSGHPGDKSPPKRSAVFTGNPTVKQPGKAFHGKPDGETVLALSANSEMPEDSFAVGFLIGLLVGEGHFGGDGVQPHVTLRMHTDHERLFRWIENAFPGGRLYGPYHHGGRRYYQWMARGPYLRETLIPLLDRYLTEDLDAKAFARYRQMKERYRI